MRPYLLSFAVLSLSVGPALADPPVIEDVFMNGSTIHVTLSHPDTGWDHYANFWHVLDDKGNVLAERELVHPHVHEQPFTRSTVLYRTSEDGAVTIVARCTNGDESKPYTFSFD